MKHAFSLVELSIVLVILGLLVGGVLSGQSLIRAAELRKVSSAIPKYQTAVLSFRDKYFALPGDMTNATSFWGALGGGGAGSGCFTAQSSDTKTCNGDGDGFIGHTGGASNGDVWFWGERFHVWNHLANAGLIEGSYTGKTDSGSDSFVAVPGKNTPPTGLSGSNQRYDIYSEDFIADGTSPYYFNGFSLKNPLLGGVGDLTVQEAWNIDTKLDDGRPGQGKMWTNKRTTTPCADSDVAATALYDFTSPGKVCGFLVKLY